MSHPSPTPPDAVTWLLQDLAPQNADVASVDQNDTNAWTVSFRDDSQLQVTWLESPPRLELLARITRLDPLVAREVLEGLLMFNLLSADSRGARMALSASDRALYLMRDLPLESLHFDGLRDSLRSLAALASQWREALTAQEARQTTSSTFPS